MTAGFRDLLVLQGIWHSKFLPPIRVVKTTFLAKKPTITSTGKAAEIEATSKKATVVFTPIDC